MLVQIGDRIYNSAEEGVAILFDDLSQLEFFRSLPPADDGFYCYPPEWDQGRRIAWQNRCREDLEVEKSKTAASAGPVIPVRATIKDGEELQIVGQEPNPKSSTKKKRRRKTSGGKKRGKS